MTSPDEPPPQEPQTEATLEDSTGPLGLSRNVRVLGLTSLVNDIASEAIYPLLPMLLASIFPKNAKLILGVVEGAADATASILKLFAGSWSDRTGRRKGWIVFGYTLGGLARPLLGLVTMPWQVFGCRVGERFGKGLRTAARDAIIAESTPPAQRGWAFGFHRAMDHLGAAIGPLLALLYVSIWPGPEHLRTLFLLTLIPGLAVVAILVFGLREPRRHGTAAVPFVWSLKPFSTNFRVYLLAMFLFSLGNSSDSLLLLRAGKLGMSDRSLILLWFTFSMTKSVGNLAVGRLVERLGARRLILGGWLAYALVYLGFGLASEPWHIWALFIAYAVFYSLTEPPEKTLVAKLVPGDRKGLAYGWYNFAIGIAALPASALCGWLYEEFGPLQAFGTGGAFALAAAVVLFAGVHNPRDEVSSAPA